MAGDFCHVAPFPRSHAPVPAASGGKFYSGSVSTALDPDMSPTIVLLPGLGADRRLFRWQCEAMPGIVVPPWPDPAPDDSLATFAKRLAASIPASRSLYLGGSSFGGMVALELAALLRPKGVILIGSCTHPSSIAPIARRLMPLAKALPVRAFHPRRWSLPLILPKFGCLTPENRQLFVEMALTTPGSFLKWGIEAMLSWSPRPVAAPIHQIHGSADRLIPLPCVRRDRVVSGGGHLLPLTHPREVNRFLAEVVSA
jgi:pimeloyl-ACP methyl ester carboxylesterase